jgi:lambda family phage minor tail protein L
MSTALVVSDLQNINPSSIIELFTLQLKNSLHGSNSIYRFHNGTSLNNNGEIFWQGNSYQRFPIQANGFAFQRGKLPRPRITISNATGFMSSILNTINAINPGNDLTGATVTRIRTLAKFIDAANFTGGVNVFGTPDPNSEFPKEIYFVDRKSTENRNIVEFELAAVFDLAGIRAPKRACTREIFPSIGTFVQ